ncbi:hypothetical protein [Glycomyces salinus]|uniref:hypothetical protein n=1 Tax=Glycomyces salinus TaxID=980294 RepID=UPI0018EE0F5B|nr:hypothetical protein [Glycomyces salinus]
MALDHPAELIAGRGPDIPVRGDHVDEIGREYVGESPLLQLMVFHVFGVGVAVESNMFGVRIHDPRIRRGQYRDVLLLKVAGRIDGLLIVLPKAANDRD